jgi:hypothetical protein
MKRSAFTKQDIGDYFYRASAYHLGDTEPDAPAFVTNGEERVAGYFDLLSEAKRAARKAMRESVAVTGSKGWEWLVERRTLESIRYSSRGEWSAVQESWSSVGGHEGSEVYAEGAK